MTHQVHRSRVPDEAAFDMAVKLHAADLEIYERHMAAVRENKADPYPAPNPHPAIDHAVRRDKRSDGSTRFVVDYEIVDALPVAPNDRVGLAQRKEEMRQRVSDMERASTHDTIPMGKWRLSMLRYQAAADKPDADRTPDEIAVIATFDNMRGRLRAIQLHYAELESQIEDLDFATINSWSPSPFKG